MTDVHDNQTRSQNMAAIKGKNTQPEILIRKELFRRGFRYRLHESQLPGKPDIVLPKYKSVILVNGCFWHGHNCQLFKIPQTRTDFWIKKIQGNRERDKKNEKLLSELGWRQAIIWECALKGKNKLPFIDLCNTLNQWLKSKTDENITFSGDYLT